MNENTEAKLTPEELFRVETFKRTLDKLPEEEIKKLLILKYVELLQKENLHKEQIAKKWGIK